MIDNINEFYIAILHELVLNPFASNYVWIVSDLDTFSFKFTILEMTQMLDAVRLCVHA